MPKITDSYSYPPRGAPPKKMSQAPGHGISIERIEKMLLICAELVDRRGPIAQPLLDRLEREYVEARTRGTAVDRIRKLIASELGAPGLIASFEEWTSSRQLGDLQLQKCPQCGHFCAEENQDPARC